MENIAGKTGVTDKSEARLSLRRHIVSQFHENLFRSATPMFRVLLIFFLGESAQKWPDLAVRPLLSAFPPLLRFPDDGKQTK